MKTNIKSALLIVLLIAAIAGFAQDRGFKYGSVYNVSFIKTGPNMSDDYVKSLKSSWKAVNDEAIKQGLIVSYKILEGSAANPDDWNIMLIQEFKNMASLDGNDEKWQAISRKVVGSDEAMKKLNESRVAVRTIYGEKLLREVVYN